ncbi:DUF5691 domain-containing protein [Microbulbifer aggregans]|uniref:DUF5691 domain-containing protein n=1 Tax=Microbulbifer aggregans TaxID=1769779 RepID=UPI001CFD9199|nr:DUF5691 domain-containing protein [Microbulbifer aggregans]
MLNRDQHEQIQSLIEQQRKRWSIGDESAIDTQRLPESWQALLQVDADAPDGMAQQRLAALALTSQYQLLMYRQKAPALTAHPPIPSLDLPPLSGTRRAAFRRLAAQLARGEAFFPATLRLMARRGVSAHPADWMPDPGANENRLPPVYRPWLQWIHQQHSAANAVIALGEDNWDDYMPGERKALIADMRRTDPSRARTLLEACIGRESAERRVALLELLQVQLVEDDINFLRGLTTDRSQKVRILCAQLLSQLNALDDESAKNTGTDDQEHDRLSEGFQVKKSGLLQRRIVVEPQKIKRGKQTQLRLEQLASVTFQQFAAALGISTQILATGWRFNSNARPENHGFVLCAIRSAGSAEIASLFENLLEEHDSDQLDHLLQTIAPRLDPQQKRDTFERLQSKKGMDISEWQRFLDDVDIELGWQQLKASRAGKDFLAEVKKSAGNDGYLQHPDLQEQLNALALLVSAADAELALEHLIQIGVLRVDPALELLKFNSQLTGESSGQRSTQNIQETP